MKDVVIAGCGDVGTRLAMVLRPDCRRLRCIVRTPRRRDNLDDIGFEALLHDLDSSYPQLSVAGACIYYLIPPGNSGVDDLRLERFLKGIQGQPERIVMISTTAVYGDCQGRWVDEGFPANPRSDRGRRRLAAETLLTSWATEEGVPWIILRVPGIYGPGRLPVARLRSGAPVLREDESPWTNRIHVDDLVSAMVRAGASESNCQVFNVSDGRPSTMTDYFNRVAGLIGMERPRQIPMAEAEREMTPAMLSYLVESRRIDNRRMRQQLGVRINYPDLNAGLRASLS